MKKTSLLLFALSVIVLSIASYAFPTQNGVTTGALSNWTDDPTDPADTLWWTGNIDRHILGGQALSWTMDLPQQTGVILKIKYGLWNSPDVRIIIRVNGANVGSVVADQGYISPGPEYAMFNITNNISAGTDLIEAVAVAGGGEAVIGYIAVGRRAGTDLAAGNTSETVVNNFRFDPAYPNPFNPETRLSFTLDQPENVTLTVFDCQGREAAVLTEGFISAGQHSFVFNASSLPSGIYYAELSGDNSTQVQKILLVK